jgi:2Fe-2S ferredoxin
MLLPKVTFIDQDGAMTNIDARSGVSILEIAQSNGIDVEGACEGGMACSTCHLIVDPDWFDRLVAASEEEEDMLDLAFGLTRTSRLGCQLTLTENMDGIIFSLPNETNNLIS